VTWAQEASAGWHDAQGALPGIDPGDCFPLHAAEDEYQQHQQHQQHQQQYLQAYQHGHEYLREQEDWGAYSASTADEFVQVFLATFDEPAGSAAPASAAPQGPKKGRRPSSELKKRLLQDKLATYTPRKGIHTAQMYIHDVCTWALEAPGQDLDILLAFVMKGGPRGLVQNMKVRANFLMAST